MEEEKVGLGACVDMQIEAVEAPVVGVYFPASQSVHRVVPGVRTESGHTRQHGKITGESQGDIASLLRAPHESDIIPHTLSQNEVEHMKTMQPYL